LLDRAGDWPQARRRLEEALDIAPEAYGPAHPIVASTLNNLGHVLAELGEKQAARRRYEEALEVCRKVLPEDHPITARARNNLAVLLLERREREAAIGLFKAALVSLEKRLGPDHPTLAVSLSNLANLHGAAGEFDEAHRLYDRAHDIQTRKLPPGHPSRAILQLNRTRLFQQQHRFEDALEAVRGVPEACDRALGPDHPITAAARYDQALTLAALRRPEEAWPLLVAAADAHARTAARLLAGSAERQHAGLVARWRHNLDTLISAAEIAPKGAGPKAEIELLNAVLDWKAASERAMLLRQEALAVAGDAEGRALYEELKAARHRLAQALIAGAGTRPAEEHRKRLDALRAAQDDLERRLAARTEAFAQVGRARQTDLWALSQRLDRGSVLVEVVRYRDYATLAKKGEKLPAPSLKPRYAAVLLTRPAAEGEPPRTHTLFLGDAAPIDAAVHAWRDAAQRLRKDDRLDAELRRLVWEPLARLLPKGTTRLYLAPDGDLALLPFEAIRLEDGSFLVERYRVGYLSSGRDLLPRPRLAAAGDAALIVSDPDYDAAADRPAKHKLPAPAHAQARSGALLTAKLHFGRLPGAAREADDVAALLSAAGSDADVRRLTGAGATEEALAAARRPRLLVLATHGFYLPDKTGPTSPLAARKLELVAAEETPIFPGAAEDPRLRSGLALAGANHWQKRSAKGLSDGLLTALEAENLDLWGTELVVLSACETGLGQVQVGEGVLGLRRAFRLAGAQSVLASLWAVPDEETGRLMKAFFPRWLDGHDPSEALRRAQLDLIRELRASDDPRRRTAPPLLWAGFVCHGRPR
jgi:CHAT domain-containing protein/tetratricopeptide (TPR) repeat protein